jgi:hypothetical protein
MKDLDRLVNAINQIQSLATDEQKEAYLKYLKKEILKLEIAVILIGLLGISIIVFLVLGFIPFNFLVILIIIIGILLIFKAFRDGESLEIEKFFLLIFMKKDKEDGPQ